MTLRPVFDPFGDFETAGYLRNELELKDPAKIKVQEHLFFTANLQAAAAYLAARDEITYEDFCQVHSILFSGFYPWAGRDRKALGVARIVGKGEQVVFADAEESKRAVSYGLELGNEPTQITKRPGEVMGLFAWGHPFLDGNGRTMVVVHTELMARAGLMVNWADSAKDAYLDALTHELNSPHDHALDEYLLPLVQPLQKGRNWIDQIRDLSGLDGMSEDIGADVAYDNNDPVGERKYKEKVQARQYTIPDTPPAVANKRRGGNKAKAD